MPTHTMHLQDDLFTKLTSGRKTIEIRVNDPKRQKVNVGDEIVFIHAEDAHRTVNTLVHNRQDFKNFQDLLATIPLSAIGYAKAEKNQLLEGLASFYAPDEEASFGVVAFYFSLADI